MKNIILTLLAIAILISCVSCNNGKVKESDVEECEIPYTVYDMNEFLQYITDSQEDTNTVDISINGGSDNLTIPIPKLIKEGYTFLCATDGSYWWNFTFVPDEYSTDEPVFFGYEILVSKNLNTIDIVAEQCGVTVVDNYANHQTPNSNLLLINMENRLVSVQSLGNVPCIDTPEKLSEYFVFEDYTIGDDNSNVAIK